MSKSVERAGIEISGTRPEIRFWEWPDIRQNCYPVHLYFKMAWTNEKEAKLWNFPGNPDVGNKLAELLVPNMGETVDPAMMGALMSACSLINAGSSTEEVKISFTAFKNGLAT